MYCIKTLLGIGCPIFFSASCKQASLLHSLKPSKGDAVKVCYMLVNLKIKRDLPVS